jgi:hypothetical protein
VTEHPKDFKKDSDAEAKLRQELFNLVVRDIKNIGCIYPSVGQALYSEPTERLAHRVANSVMEVLKKAKP